jgi:CO/xanthine dehydrogenase Mo-binding subunit
VLRSPHAHALIRSIDMSEAAALPGILCILTATI